MTKKIIGKLGGDFKSEYNFSWQIEKFSDDFKLLESETFSIYPLCNSSWKVLVLFCPLSQKLKLGMRRMDEDLHSVSVTCVFCLRNSNEILFAKRKLVKTFSNCEESLYCDLDLNKPSIERGVKNDMGHQFRLCADDVLVVEGKITILPCCSQHNEQNSDQLLNALRNSLADKTFTDVQIFVDGDVMEAHKFMLAARSPVFKCMLETKMKEENDGRIVITDVDKSVFQMFLTFLYTGSITDCDFFMLIQLYTVADKYDVQSLVTSCSNSLSSLISETTVCDILSLADMHNDKTLMEEAFQYLCKEFELVEPTEEWERFVKENTLLAAKVVRKVASSISTQRET